MYKCLPGSGHENGGEVADCHWEKDTVGGRLHARSGDQIMLFKLAILVRKPPPPLLLIVLFLINYQIHRFALARFDIDIFILVRVKVCHAQTTHPTLRFINNMKLRLSVELLLFLSLNLFAKKSLKHNKFSKLFAPVPKQRVTTRWNKHQTHVHTSARTDRFKQSPIPQLTDILNKHTLM